MDKKRIISNLIIANLVIIFLILLGKFQIIHEFINVLIWVIFTPIIFGVFLFYLFRPLSEIFIKKGINRSRSALLTLVIVAFFLGGIFKYFGGYLIGQINQLRNIVDTMIYDEEIMNSFKNYIQGESLKSMVENLSTQLGGYINFLISNAKDIFDKGMMLFSNFLLVILITFFLLRDGDQFKEKVLKYIPERYKKIANNTLSDGDKVLSTYIIGQSVVAISLATMVLVGYLIIKMPSAFLLAFTTFILAFIPFVGFFISMIIPYIIAVVSGFDMVIKLSILFIIAQTLKGRVVVPFIMGRAMKIHPITDIFLVVGAAAIGGPLAAFCIVPIYSLLKLLYKNLRAKKINNKI